MDLITSGLDSLTLANTTSTRENPLDAVTTYNIIPSYTPDTTTVTSKSDTMPKRLRDEYEAASTMSHEPHPIINALHDFVQKERMRNFYFLGRHSHSYMNQQQLLVVSQADPDIVKGIRKAAGREISTIWDDWFTFTEPLRSHGFARTVAIEILPGDDITVENMTIIEFGRRTQNMRDATNWLRDTYEDAQDLAGVRFSEMRYEEQRLWWESTGQAFRLLDLPGEMREAIYLQILEPVVVPDIITYPRRKLVIGIGQSIQGPERIGRNRDPDLRPPNMHIMRTRKQVYAEATQVAHRDTIKRFTATGAAGNRRAFPEATKASQAIAATIYNNAWILAPDTQFLRHIQLEMSASKYLEFIGIRPRYDLPFQPTPRSAIHIRTLQKFPGLLTLDFRFISPKHPHAACPWSSALGHRGNTTHACQKKWIDIFFVLAWPHLEALDKVKFSLSGCVKNSSRVYWENVLNDKKVNHAPDIAAQHAQMLDIDIQQELFDCECTNPCMEEVDAGKVFQFSEYEVRMCEGLRGEVDKAYWDFED